eukprot:scaffold99632_cov43-Phaeocystis_antarctica.AAC.1
MGSAGPGPEKKLGSEKTPPLAARDEKWHFFVSTLTLSALQLLCLSALAELSRLRRPIRLEPSRYRCVVWRGWYREGGECWHVRPRMLCVPRAKVPSQGVK